ncbi:hypothetical protein Aduo_015769 [Ancylostoma duodenale]
MGMELSALSDTGSETSLIPLSVFRRAREKNVDVVEIASKQTDMFESENAALAPRVCKISMEGIKELPAVSVSHEPMLFQKREVAGSWQNKDCVPQAALAE